MAGYPFLGALSHGRLKDCKYLKGDSLKNLTYGGTCCGSVSAPTYCWLVFLISPLVYITMDCLCASWAWSTGAEFSHTEKSPPGQRRRHVRARPSCQFHPVIDRSPAADQSAPSIRESKPVRGTPRALIGRECRYPSVGKVRVNTCTP